MGDLDLDRIEAGVASATPGPWKLWGMDVLADPVGDSNLDTALPIARTTDPHRGLKTFNADFIAAARTDVPTLVARVRELEAATQSMISPLQKILAIWGHLEMDTKEDQLLHRRAIALTGKAVDRLSDALAGGAG